VARRVGVFAEPSSCTALAGLIKAEAMHLLPDDGPVVVVLTGHGLKDPDAAMTIAAPEVVIPPSRDALETEILVSL
jgi:threonine synthase